MKATAEQIHSHLANAKKIAIVTHPNPDEDALGSVAALSEYIGSLGRNARIFCSTPASERLGFLPNPPQIETDLGMFDDPELDTIITLDLGDLRHAGIAEIAKNHPATIINIDHHATNEYFGRFNLVTIDASATAEIIYHYFQHNHVPVSRHMATNLLAGLIGDTDNFTNGATKPSSLAIAGELVRLGANYKLVNFHTQKDKSFALLKLWGKALTRLSKNEKLNMAYTYLKRSDYEAAGLSENDGDGLADFMNNLDGAKIILVLKESADGKIKGSLRTTYGDTDVAALAKIFGGGGHKKAAGFTTEGTIEEVLMKILTLNGK